MRAARRATPPAAGPNRGRPAAQARRRYGRRLCGLRSGADPAADGAGRAAFIGDALPSVPASRPSWRAYAPRCGARFPAGDRSDLAILSSDLGPIRASGLLMLTATVRNRGSLRSPTLSRACAHRCAGPGRRRRALAPGDTGRHRDLPRHSRQRRVASSCSSTPARPPRPVTASISSTDDRRFTPGPDSRTAVAQSRCVSANGRNGN